MTSIFLSYARGDDALPFDPATSFVARLHRDLTARGFEVWFDRMAMPSRGLTFHQEIQDAVAARQRLVLVVGPKAAVAGQRGHSRLFFGKLHLGSPFRGGTMAVAHTRVFISHSTKNAAFADRLVER